MKPLRIMPTSDCPNVIFDKEAGIFEISGVSIPENVKKFFSPIFTWTEEYIQNPNPFTLIEIKLTYCNSATLKILSLLIDTFEKILEKRKRVLLHWYHFPEDEDMINIGKELAEMTDIPVEFHLLEKT